MGVRRLLKVVTVAMTAALLPPSVGVGPASASGTQAEHWGSFFEGNGSEGRLVAPTPIALPGPVVQVATSNSTQYALLDDGSVYAWGLGGHGQLGDGGTANSLGVPVQVQFPPGVTIADLPTDVMPFDTGLAIDTTGHPWGWGLDSAGQLCLGNDAEHLTPVELPFSDVTAMAGAGGHALYDSGGTVYACGSNAHGDLGDGTTGPSRTPAEVEGLPTGDVTTLVASFNDSGALLANGTYFDWGYDAQGQLGDRKTGVASSVPVAVNLPLPVTQVAQGGSYSGNGQTLVMLADGSLRAWGDGQNGQLGDGATANHASPKELSPPPGVTYERLAAGAITSYAVSTTGDVYSWGGGGSGQIGNGGTGMELQPVQVETGVSLISATANDVVTS